MAATYAQPGSSQPTFVPPGMAAVPPQVPAVAAPGNAVMYYPQGAGGMGAVIVVRQKTISAFCLKLLIKLSLATIVMHPYV